MGEGFICVCKYFAFIDNKNRFVCLFKKKNVKMCFIITNILNKLEATQNLLLK